jgi:hypothetical protein
MDSRANDIRDDSTNEIVSRFLSTPFKDNQDLTVVIDIVENFSQFLNYTLRIRMRNASPGHAGINYSLH